MITDRDIEKLKTIFVTKDDLKKELSNYPTKQDLKNELANYATKQDLEVFGDNIVKEITDIVTIFADKFDESMAEIKAIKIISQDHEKRLQLVEKRKMN